MLYQKLSVSYRFHLTDLRCVTRQLRKSVVIKMGIKCFSRILLVPYDRQNLIFTD